MHFPGGSDSKESACNAGYLGLILELGRSLEKRMAWQPTPVFLPGEFHGQRSLAGCSPQGYKESDTAEQPLLLLGVLGVSPVNSFYSYLGGGRVQGGRRRCMTSVVCVPVQHLRTSVVFQICNKYMSVDLSILSYIPIFEYWRGASRGHREVSHNLQGFPTNHFHSNNS